MNRPAPFRLNLCILKTEALIAPVFISEIPVVIVVVIITSPPVAPVTVVVIVPVSIVIVVAAAVIAAVPVIVIPEIPVVVVIIVVIPPVPGMTTAKSTIVAVDAVKLDTVMLKHLDLAIG